MQAQENWTLILMVFAGAPVVLLQILIRSIFYGRQSNRRTSHFSFSFSLSLSHKHTHTHTHTLSLFLGKILSASSLIMITRSLRSLSHAGKIRFFVTRSPRSLALSLSLTHTHSLFLGKILSACTLPHRHHSLTAITFTCRQNSFFCLLLLKAF